MLTSTFQLPIHSTICKLTKVFSKHSRVYLSSDGLYTMQNHFGRFILFEVSNLLFVPFCT
jgi:hypothetical protein